MILVVGATGTVGRATVEQLAARGLAVRALVRSPEKAAAVAGPGVETALGDLESPRSLDAALAGVARALLVSPLDPRQVALQGNFVAAAKRAGRVHVVKLSGLGTAADSPVRSGRWHAQVERRLEDAGLPFTHLRPPFFMQNVVRSFAATVAAHGEMLAPMRDGAVAMVDARDVAAVAAVALTADGHAGRAYTVTGPRALSFGEVAAKLSLATGKAVSYRDVPLEAMRRRLAAAGTPPWHIDVLSDFWTVLRDGCAAQVTDAVEVVTGTAPRSFEQFAREHADRFRGG